MVQPFQVARAAVLTTAAAAAAALVAPTAHAHAGTEHPSMPPPFAGACPRSQAPDEADAALRKYHGDAACDRDAFNAFKDGLPLEEQRRHLQRSGRHAAVPTSRTVACPLPGAPVASLYRPGQATGFDATWIVENAASAPVAVAWVDPDSGVEYSARDPDLPVGLDPEAVVPPGQWAALQTFEGHVFHVRRVEEDGSLGPIVLQHRAGLVPVAGDCGVDAFDAQRQAAAAHVADVADGDSDSYGEDDDWEEEDEFRRTPPQSHNRRCNRLEVGFRNLAGCPLLGYFVEPETCDEEFKFHLGAPSTSSQFEDFMHDWDSPTKFESTFVGQTFVFRNAVTGHMVDRITLRPTQVVDCPDGSSASASASAPIREAVVVSAASGQSLPLLLNHTAAASDALLGRNSTSSTSAPPRPQWVASSFGAALASAKARTR